MRDFDAESLQPDNNIDSSDVINIKSPKAFGGYIVYLKKGVEPDSLGLRVAHDGAILQSAGVFENESDIQQMEEQGVKIEPVEIPEGSDREIFLRKWTKAITKNKRGLTPLLLLPLAACGGGSDTDEGGDSSSVTVADAAAQVAASETTVAFKGGVTGAVADFLTGGSTSADLNAVVGDDPDVNLTITDASGGSVSAANLAAIGASTSGTVTLSNAQTITGTAAQATSALVTSSSKVVLGAGSTVSVSDATAVASAAALAGVTNATVGFTSGITGAVSALASDGSVTSNLSAVVSDDADVAISVTDASGTVTASNLSAIGGATSGTVTVSNAQTITGTAAQATSALVTSSSKVVLGAGSTVSVSDATAVASAATLAGVTNATVSFENGITGTVSDLLSSGSASTALAAVLVDDADVSIAVTDASIDASNVVTLDSITSGVVTVQATGLTGTVANVKAVFQGNVSGSVSGLGNESITLSAGEASASDLLYISSQLSGGGSFDFSNITAISGSFTELTNLYGEGGTMPLPANVTLKVTGPISASSIVALDATSSGAALDVSGATVTDVNPSFTADEANGLKIAGLSGIELTDASASATYDFSGFASGAISNVEFSSGGAISASFVTGGQLASYFASGADFTSVDDLSLDSTGQAITLTGTVFTFTTSARTFTVSGSNNITVKGLATGPGATSVSLNNQLSAGSFNITGGSPAIDLDASTTSLNVIMDGQGSMAVGTADTSAGDSDGVQGIVGAGLTALSVTYQSGAKDTSGTLDLGAIDTPETGALADNFAVSVANLSGGTVQETDVQLNAAVASGNTVSFDGVTLKVDQSATFGTNASVSLENTAVTAVDGESAALPALPVAATSDLTVDGGKTLTLTALEANNITSGGGSVSGLGIVEITDIGSTPTADLSSILPSGSLAIVLTGDVDLASGSKIGNVNLNVEGGDLDIGAATTFGVTSAKTITVASGASITASGSQISGLTVAGAGGLNIEDASSVDLSDVSLSGTISASATTGNLSSANLSKINGTLTLSGATTLPDSTSDMPTAINAASQAITVAASADLTGVTFTNPGNLTINSGQTVSMTAAQVTAFNAGGTLTNSGTLNVSATGDLSAQDLGGVTTVTLTGATTLPNSTSDMPSAINAASQAITVAASADLTGVTFSNPDNLTINSGQTATLTLAQLTAFEAAGTVTNNGTLNVTAASGNLSADNLSVVDGTLTLSGATTLPDSTSDMPTAINAASQAITVAASADLTGVTISNYGDLTINASQTATLTLAQITAFNAGGTLTNNGTMNLSVSGDLSAQDLGGVTTVTLTGATTLPNSTSDMPSAINAASQAITVAASADLTGVTFTNPGNLTINASQTATLTLAQLTAFEAGGTVTNNGTLNVTAASGNLSADNLSVVDGTLTLSGATTLPDSTSDMPTAINAASQAITVAASADLTGVTFTNPGNLTINSSQTVSMTAAQVTAFNAGGTLTNSGTLNVSATGDLSAQDLGGVTTVTLTGATTLPNSTSDMPSAINAASQAITVAASADLTGVTISNYGDLTINASQTATLTLAQLTAFEAGGTVTNNGTLNVTAASGNLSVDNLSVVDGTLTLSGATTLPDSTSDMPTAINAASQAITVAASADLTGVTFTNPGNLTVNSGQTVSMTAAQVTAFNAGGTLTNSGTLNVSATGDLSAQDLGGVTTVTLTGATTLPNSTSDMPSAIDAASQAITVAASADLTGVTFTNPGNLTVNSSQTVSMTAAQVTAFNAGGTLTNSGTLNVSATGDLSAQDLGGVTTVTLTGATTLPNSTSDMPSAINAASQAITVAASADLTGVTFTNPGNLTINASQTVSLTLAQLTAFEAGGTVTNNGTLNVTAASGNLSADNLSVVDGTLTLSGATTLPDSTSDMPTAINAASQAITVAASADLTGVTFSNPDNLTINASQTVSLTLAQLTAFEAGGTVTNNGTLNVTAASGNLSADNLSVVDGTLTLSGATTLPDSTSDMPTAINAASQAITVAASADLTGVTFTNPGDLTINASQTVSLTLAQLTAFEAGGTVTNNGTLNVTAASGNLSADNLSVVDGTLTLSGATTLPDSTSDMPTAINAASQAITVAASADLTGVTISNYGDLTINASQTVSLTLAQLTAFEAGGTVTNNGTLNVTAASGNLSADNLSVVDGTLTLSGATTLPDSTSDMPSAINAASQAITVAASADLTGVTFTNPGNLTINASQTATLTLAQLTAFEAGGTVTNNGTLNVTAASGNLSADNLSVVDGTLTLSGATTLPDSTSDMPTAINAASQAITVAASADLTGVTFTNPGNLTINSSQTVSMTAAQVTAFNAGGTLTNSGTLNVSATGDLSAQDLGGVTTVTLTGATTLPNSTSDMPSAINAASQAITVAASADLTGVTFSNPDNLTINASQTVSMTAAQVTAFNAGGTLTNSGTLNVSATGDLSAQDLGGVTTVTLTGATTLPNSTSDMPSAIDAASQAITVAASADLTGVTISNYGDLTINASQTATLTLAQLTAFEAGGTVTNNGTLNVTAASGNLSADNLSVVDGTLTLSGATTLPDSTSDMPTAINAASQAITVAASADLTGVTFTNPGNLTINSSQTVSMTAAQVTAFNAGGTLTNSGTLNVSATGDLSAQDLGGVTTVTLTGATTLPNSTSDMPSAINAASQAITVAASADLTGVTFTNPGNLTVNSSQTVSMTAAQVTAFNAGGTLTNSGTLNVSATGDLSAQDLGGVTTVTLTGATTLPNSTSDMPSAIDAASQAITVAASADLTGVTFSNPDNLTINASQTVSLTLAQLTAFEAGGTVTNNGTLNVTAASGNLSADNLSVVDGTLTLSGATTLPDSTSDMPTAINAASQAITVAASADLTGVTISNYGDLTINSSQTVSLTLAQITAFNAGGTLTNNGTMNLSVSGDLSAQDLGGVTTVTLTGATTLPNSTSDMPTAINAASQAITVAASADLTGVTFTNPGDLTINSSQTVSLTLAQLTAFEAGGTVTNNGTLNVTAASGNLSADNLSVVDGTLTLSGATTLPDSTSDMPTAINAASQAITVAASADLTGVTFTNPGNLTINASQTVSLTLAQLTAFEAAGTVTNNGTLNVTAASGNLSADNLSVVDGTLTLSGATTLPDSTSDMPTAINAASQAITVAASADLTGVTFTNPGDLTINASQTVSLTLAQLTAFEAGGTVTNNGTLNVTAASGNLSADNLSVVDGTLTLSGATTLPDSTSDMPTAINAASQAITVAASADLTGVTFTNPGNLTINSSQTVSMTAAQVTAFNAGGTLTNSGTLNVSATGDLSAQDLGGVTTVTLTGATTLPNSTSDMPSAINAASQAITVAASADLTGVTFSNPDNLTINASQTVSMTAAQVTAFNAGGTLTNSGTLNVSATGDLSAQDLGGVTTVTLTGATTLPNSTSDMPSAIDAASQAITVAASADLTGVTFTNPGNLTINSSQTVSLTLAQLTAFEAGGTVTNNGTLNVTAASGNLSADNLSVVDGTLTLSGATTLPDSTSDMPTAINAASQAITVAASADLTGVTFTNPGDLTINASQTVSLTLAQLTAFEAAGTVTNNGTLNVTAASGNLSADNLSVVDGTLTLSGATTLPDSTSDMPTAINAASQAITVAASADLTGVTFTNPGDLTINASQTVSLTLAQLTAFEAGGTVTNNGTLNVTAASGNLSADNLSVVDGTLTLSGATTLPDSTSDMPTAINAASQAITVAASADLTGVTFTNPGNLTINSSQTVSMTAAQVTAFNAGGTLTNSGTLNVSATGDLSAQDLGGVTTVTLTGATTLPNSTSDMPSAIDAASQAITVAASADLTGVTISNYGDLTINASQTATLTLAQLTAFEAAGTVTNNGTLNVTAASGNLSADNLSVVDGTLTLSGATTLPDSTSDMPTAINAASQAITVAASADLTGVTFTNPGNLTVNFGNTLTLTLAQMDQFAAGGTLSNNGNLNITNASGDISGRNLSNVNEVTLNGSTTVPDSTSDFPGSMNLSGNGIIIASSANLTSVTFTNHGALTINSGQTAAMTAAQVTAFNAGGTLTNSGTLNVSATGDLSAQDLGGVTTVTLTGATTLPNSTSDMPSAIDAASQAITVAASADLTGVTFTNPGNLTINASQTVSLTLAQLTAFEAGGTVTNNGTLNVTAASGNLSADNLSVVDGTLTLSGATTLPDSTSDMPTAINAASQAITVAASADLTGVTFTNPGDLTINASQTVSLTLAQLTAFEAGGTVTNNGTLNVTAASGNLSADNLSVVDGTLTLSGATTLPDSTSDMPTAINAASQAITVAASADLTGVTISNYGDLTINASQTATLTLAQLTAFEAGGTVTNNGTLNVTAASGNLSADNLSVVDGTLTLSGATTLPDSTSDMPTAINAASQAITVAASADLTGVTFTNPGNLTINSSQTVSMTAAQVTAFNAGGTLTNSGTLNVSATGDLSAQDLGGVTTVTLTGATTLPNSTSDMPSAIDAASQAITVAASADLTGVTISNYGDLTINASQTATLTLAQLTAFEAAGTVTNNGTLNVTAASGNLSADNLSVVDGTLTLSGATTLPDSTSDMPTAINAASQAITVAASADLTGVTFTNPGNLTINSSQTVSMTAAQVTAFNAGGTLTNSGTLNVSATGDLSAQDLGGVTTVTLTGATTLPNSTSDMPTAINAASQAITVAASADLTGVTFTNPGNLTVNSSQTVSMTAAQVTAFNAGGTLTNSGTLNVSATGDLSAQDLGGVTTVTLTGATTLPNSTSDMPSAIDAASQAITVAASADLTGVTISNYGDLTINASQTATLTLAQITAFNAGGTLTNNGTMNLSVSGDLSAQDLGGVTTVTLTGATTLPNSTSDMPSAINAASQAITVAASADLTGVTFTNPGNLTINASQTATLTLAQLTAFEAGGTVTNNGTLNVTAASGNLSADNLSVVDGTLTLSGATTLPDSTSDMPTAINAASQAITVAASADLTGVTFTNPGNLTINSSQTVSMTAAQVTAFNAGGTLTNSGTLNVSATGDLSAQDLGGVTTVTLTGATTLPNSTSDMPSAIDAASQAITVAASADLTGVTFTNPGNLTVNSSQTVSMTAAQVTAFNAGGTLTNSGTLNVSATGDLSAQDLGGVTTVTLTGATTLPNSTSDMPSAIDAASQAITVAASADLTGVTFTNPGNLTVNSSQTVSMTAAQVTAFNAGGTLTNSGTLNVSATGDLSAQDLGGVTTVTLTGATTLPNSTSDMPSAIDAASQAITVAASADLTGVTISNYGDLTINASQTATLTLAQLTAFEAGGTVTNNGTLNVTAASGNLSADNLSVVDGTLTLSGATTLPDSTSDMPTAINAASQAITVAASADLTGVTFTNPGNLTINSSQTVSMTAAQVTAFNAGGTLTNSGTLNVSATGDLSAQDLGGVTTVTLTGATTLPNSTSDMPSAINAASQAITVAASADLTGVTFSNPDNLTINASQTATLTLAQLTAFEAGGTVTNNGTLNVTAASGNLSADNLSVVDGTLTLSGATTLPDSTSDMPTAINAASQAITVAASADLTGVTFTNPGNLTINSSQTVSLTLAQLTAFEAGGTVTNNGTLNVTAASGNLSADNLSVVDGTLTLSGATTLPDSTSDMPTAINAASQAITVAASADLTGVTFTNPGNLTVNFGKSVTLKLAQLDAFEAGGNVSNNGTINITQASGNLSAQNFSSVSSLKLSGATTLPDGTSDLPDTIDATSQAITIASSIDLTGVTVSNSGSLTVNSSQTALMTAAQVTAFNAGGTLTNNGTLNVSATGDLSAQDLGGVSTLTLTGATTLPDSTSDMPTAINAASQAITVAASADLTGVTISNYGDLTINGSQTATLTLAQVTAFNAGGTLTNNGTMNLSASGDLSAQDLGGVSTLTLSGATTLPDSTSDMPSAINAASQAITVAASADLTGVTISNYGDLTINASQTATLTLAQLTAFEAGGTVTNNGTLNVTAASGNLSADNLSVVDGTLTLSGATTLPDSTSDMPTAINAASQAITVAASADLTGVTFTNPGNLTINSSQTVSLTLAQLTAFEAGGTVTNNGTLNVTAASGNLSADNLSVVDGTLTLSGATTLPDSTSDMPTAINAASQAITVAASADLTGVTFTNPGDLTINASQTVSLTLAQLTAFEAAGTVTNNGTLNVTAASGNLSADNLSVVDGTLTLSGATTLPDSTSDMPTAINAASQAITVAASADLTGVTFTNPGDLTINASQTVSLTLAQLTAFEAGGTVTNNGTLNVTAASGNLSADNLSVVDGTLTLSGATTLPDSTSDMPTAINAASQAITVAASADLTGVTFTNPGNLTINSSQTVSMTAAQVTAFNAGGTLTNSGTLNVSATGDLSAQDLGGVTTVTLTGATTLPNSTSDMPSAIDAASQAITVAASADLTGVTFSNPDNLTINSSQTATLTLAQLTAFEAGGTVTNNGTLNVTAASGNLSADNLSVVDGTLTLSGATTLPDSTSDMPTAINAASQAITVAASADLTGVTFTNPGNLTVNSSQTVSMTAAQVTAFNAGGTLTNSGTLNVSATGDLSAQDLGGVTTVTLTGATTLPNSTSDMPSAINAASQAITVAASADLTGVTFSNPDNLTINASQTVSLTLAQLTAFEAGGTVTNNGTLNVTAASGNLSADNLSVVDGTLTLSGATTLPDSTSDMPTAINAASQAITVAASADLTGVTFTNPGNLTINASQTVSLTLAQLTAFEAGGTVTNNGTLNVTAASGNLSADNLSVVDGTLTLSGATTLPDSTSDMPTAINAASQAITVAASADLTGVTFTNPGNLTVNSSQTVSMTAAQVTAFNAGGTLTNSGTLNVSATGDLSAQDLGGVTTVTLTGATTLPNSTSDMPSAINAASQAITVAASADLTGVTFSNPDNLTINASQTATLTLAQLTAFEAGGTVTNNGTLNVTAASGNLSADNLSVVDGTLTLSGATTLPDSTSDMPTAINAASQAITVAASADLTGVTFTNPGNLTINSGQTVSMTAAQVTAFNAGGTLTNSGTLNVSATGDLSAQDLGGVTTVTLTGATTLPNSTSDMPSAIDAASQAITVAASADLTGVTFSNPDNLTINASQTATLTLAQLTAFEAGGTVTNNGTLNVTAASGNLSADNLSVVDGTLTLSGATTLPDSTSDMPTAINAASQAITVAASADLTGVTFTNPGNLTINSGQTATLTLAQLTAFEAAGTVTNNGTLNVTAASGNLSADNLSVVDGTLTLSGATTLPDSTSDMPTAINAASQAITVAASADLTGVTFTNPGNLTINSGQTVSMTAAQVSIFNSGGTLTNNGALDVSASGDLTGLNLSGVSNLTLTGNTTMTATQANSFVGQVVKGSYSISIDVSGDISSLDTSLADNVSVGTGVNLTATIAQHDSITSGLAGSNTITLSNPGTVNANSSVEAYNLANGTNTFTSSSSGHTVVGGTGSDTMIGGNGIDVFTGSTGVDEFTGGSGADVFKFASGDTGISSISDADTITDFVSTVDKIQLLVSGAVGNVSVSNWTTAITSENLTSEANSAFDGTGIDILVKVSNFIGSTVAIDLNESGSFDSGDILLQLDSVVDTDDILSSDFII